MDHQWVSNPINRMLGRFMEVELFEKVFIPFVNMMISRFVEEVYAEDKVMYRKVMAVLRSHDVDEREIREYWDAHRDEIPPVPAALSAASLPSNAMRIRPSAGNVG